MKTRTTRPSRFASGVVLPWLLALGAAGTASAQSVDPARPFRGLFGTSSTTSAALAAEIYQGVNSGTGFGRMDAPFDHGMFTGLTTGLTAHRIGRKTTLGAHGVSMLRYFADTGQAQSIYAGGTIGLRHQMRRAAIELQERIVHQPTFEFGVLGGVARPRFGSLATSDPESGLAALTTLAATSSVGLSYQAGRYRWLSGGYSHTYTRISADQTSDEVPLLPVQPTVHWQDVDFRLTQMWRNTGIYLGMNSSKGGFARGSVEPSAWIHTFDFGVDRAQNFSLTKTTTMSLNGGATMLNDYQGRRYVLVGAAGLEKRFARTTKAGVTARRDVHFIEGVTDPVLTNGLTLRVESQFANRWGINLRASAVRGHVAADSRRGGDVPYTGYGATARLLVRIAGPFSGYGEYVVYQQQFDQVEGVFLGPPIDRRGIRFGVAINLPLYGVRGAE